MSEKVAELRGFPHRGAGRTARIWRGGRDGIECAFWILNAETAEHTDGAGAFGVLAQKIVRELGVTGGHAETVWSGWAITLLGCVCVCMGVLSEYLSEGFGPFLACPAKDQAVFSPWVIRWRVADGNELGFSESLVCNEKRRAVSKERDQG